MRRLKAVSGAAGLIAVSAVVAFAGPQGQAVPETYHNPRNVNAVLKTHAEKHPALARLILMGESAGGRTINALRLAAEPKGSRDPEARPAVLVTANLEGVHLPGTEAAMHIASALLDRYGKDPAVTTLLDTRTIYIAPLLNPDGAEAYFRPVRYEKRSNDRPLDLDADGRVDEDGFNDLNGDGWITQMRVKDPEGKWIPDPGEPRLMRLADPLKDEKGIYKIYPEGLDDDGDGRYCEDPPGGAEPNRNFLHDFEYFTKEAGPWPASESETIALLKFMSERNHIALVLSFSTENTILNLQQTGQARVGGDKVKVPPQFAGFLGLDPDAEYTLKEIVEVIEASGMARGMTVDESMVAMFLGLGPAVTLDREDLKIYEAVQKDYREALKAAGIDYPERRARSVGKGSFAAYAYYQFGVPVFSTDVWTVPEPKKDDPEDVLTADKIRTMTSEQFLALGEEKIDAFLKSSGAPPTFNAAMLMGMVKSGQVTPARMADMMDKMPGLTPAAAPGDHPDSYLLHWSDTALDGRGFVPWTPFSHPTLGEVEIGGFVPFLKIVPPREKLSVPLETHAEFYIGLMGRLAELEVRETRVEPLDEGLYRLIVFAENTGWLPTATAQGRRALSAWPIRVTVGLDKGQSLFSGRPIESIPLLAGGETRRLEWIVRGRKGSRVTVTLWSPKLGTVETTALLK